MLLSRLGRALPLIALAALCACAERTPIALTDPPVCVQTGLPVKAERTSHFDLVKGNMPGMNFRCRDGTAISVGNIANEGGSARLAAINADATEYVAWEIAPHQHYIVAIHPSVFVTIPLDADTSPHITVRERGYPHEGVEPTSYIVSSVLPDAERVRVFGPHLRATTVELAPESHQNIGGVRIRRSGGSIRVDSPRDGHIDEAWNPWR